MKLEAQRRGADIYSDKKSLIVTIIILSAADSEQAAAGQAIKAAP